MNSTTKTALKWGLGIGLANLIWLYLAFYLGLHTNGIWVFQIFMLVWFCMTLTGFILALRALKRQQPALSYLRGLGTGALAALASSLVAVVAQVGYFKVIHPAWPAVMMQQTREHFTAQGMPAAEVEQMVERARGDFTLTTYAVASAVTALVTGIVLTAIIMIFLRRRAATPAEGSKPG